MFQSQDKRVSFIERHAEFEDLCAIGTRVSAETMQRDLRFWTEHEHLCSREWITIQYGSQGSVHGLRLTANERWYPAMRTTLWPRGRANVSESRCLLHLCALDIVILAGGDTACVLGYVPKPEGKILLARLDDKEPMAVRLDKVIEFYRGETCLSSAMIRVLERIIFCACDTTPPAYSRP